ncbi:MAG: glycosyltransferase family 2 protein [Candidatus Diapherotrites archaeon]
MKKATIIILNWNRWELTRDCLNSLRENTDYADYEVIVVDNGSTDGSAGKIKKEFPGARLIANKKNLGFAAANNQGFKAGKGEYFFMLSNDTILTKGWLTNAVKVMESGARIGVVGCEEVTNLDDFRAGRYGKGEDRDALTVSGATMLIKREVIENVGMLDEKEFSPAYGEESDLNYRARNSGYRIVQTYKSSIMHYGGKSSSQLGKEKQYVLANTNRLKAMLYNLALPDLLRHVPGLGLIFVNSVREGRAHFLLGTYWANIKNLRRILDERKKRFARAGEIRRKIFGE